MSEPQLPDWEEVEASGAAAWVDKAVSHHQRKQEKIARELGGEKANLRREKDALAQLFSSLPEPAEEPADRGPDVFAQERRQAESSRQSLAQMFGEEQKARQAEEDALRNLFGGGGGGGGKRKGRR